MFRTNLLGIICAHLLIFCESKALPQDQTDFNKSTSHIYKIPDKKITTPENFPKFNFDDWKDVTFPPQDFHNPDLDRIVIKPKFEVVTRPNYGGVLRILLYVFLALNLLWLRCLRSCGKSQEDAVQQTSILVLVTENENTENATATREEPPKPSTDEGTPPPSYDEAVMISPLPTYEEIIEKRDAAARTETTT